MTSREIAYNSYSILFDSIPSWGKCHRRMGRHVILEAENQENCFKCISIVSKSANVLQIHTNGVNNQERCYASEDEARQSCPSQQVIVNKNAYFPWKRWFFDDWHFDEIFNIFVWHLTVRANLFILNLKLIWQHVSFSFKKMYIRSKPRIFYINRIFGKGKLKKWCFTKHVVSTEAVPLQEPTVH